MITLISPAHYNYPGIYQTQDFHHCGLESGDDIVNYSNRVEVQTCELVNLAEYVSYQSDWLTIAYPILLESLATDTEYVRARLATYVNDLLSLGVVGLRLDAAKRKYSRIGMSSHQTKFNWF
jgi:glycosidase